MSTNKIQEGDVIDFVSLGAVVAGAVVVMGDIIGVALSAAAASGETIAVAVKGVFEVIKVTGTAYAAGDSLDWDAANTGTEKAKGTPVTGDVENCCTSIEVAASGALLVKVLLTPGTGTFKA